ncbi:hypothetical protein R3P38DRAFT_2983597 [Favolaschia claudopus]|uniref:Uncharacterized protein n=1 Tax=Favolaschia claudopus TaxID=2862362 RepID=A0AAW0AYH3_9AGAR
MPTLVQYFTFIYAYACDVLSRLLAIFHGSLINRPTDTSVGEADLTFVDETPQQEDVDPGSAPNPVVALQLSTGEITFDDLMRVAVAYANEDLPDLPATFKHEAPPAVEFPPSYVCKQIFGPPSNMFYDQRPMDNVTNYREVEDAVGFKLDVNMNLEGKPCRTRRAKRAKANANVKVRSGDKRVRFEDVPKVQVYGVDDPPTVLAVEEAPTAVDLVTSTVGDTCPVPELPTIAEPVAQAHAEQIVPLTTPNPSSPLSTNITPTPVLKESTVSPSTRRPCGQVRTSRRPASRLLPPPLPIPVPLPEPVAPCFVPAILDSARWSPRRKLQDRLSALLEDSKATIDALENINPKASTGTFSAVALEEGRTEIFVIGDDDEEDTPATKRSWRRASSHLNRILRPRPNGSIV